MELFKSRTRVVYTNAVGDKVYPVVVDIKKGIKSTEDIQFVSSDVNTGILSVAFIQGNDNYNVTGADVVCSVMRPDASTLELPCEVVGENIVEVPLGINGTSQDGVYSFDFKVLKGGNKVVGTPIMNYSVSLSIGNDMVVEEDDRLPVLTMLMTQVNELKEETSETINQANIATEASKEATANAIEATNNANAVSERVSQETATAISEIKQDTENAIDSINQSTSTAISTMNQNTTDAIADMTQKTNEAVTRVNDNLTNINNTVATKVAELDTAKSDMTNTVSNKIQEVETRFNALTSAQQQSSEVIDARDGETSLKARLDRDIEKAKQVYVNVEGSNISTDSSSGYLKDIEILGNTIQNASNLADIRSVGDTVEGQELYEIPVLSCGKNLWNYGDAKFVPKNADRWCNFEGTNELMYGNMTDKTSVKIHLKEGNYYATYDVSNSKNINSVQLVEIQEKSTYSLLNNVLSLQEGVYTIRIKNELATETVLKGFMICASDVATPYEPYQEDKLTILSPVQLEKVGDVRDRLIEKDGVLGVEKNVDNIVFNGSEQWQYNLATKEFYLTKSNYIYDGNYGCICDKFTYGETGGSYNNVIKLGNAIFVSLRKDDITNVNDFKAWLQNNNVLVMFITPQPQFIPLPHDQQVKLRTFANKTNISFGCEIEGTIKAQVPKSLGATVNTHTEQINNLNKELDRVKKLEESTVSTVETESDFTTVEATSNGYFEDVKLEGKTLVNLWDINKMNKVPSISVADNYVTVNADGSWIDCHPRYTAGKVPMLKPNTEYTVITHIKNNTLDSYMSLNVDNANRSPFTRNITIEQGFTGYYICKLNTKTDLSKADTSLRCQVGSSCTTGSIVFNCILLEGDHTQNPPSGYIEGLKSVGQNVDEVSVESVNKNLFNGVTSGTDRRISTSNGYMYEQPGYSVTDYIKIKPSTGYVVSTGETYYYSFYDKDKKYISGGGYNSRITSPQNAQYIRFDFKTVNINIVQIEKGVVATQYTPHQSDKKRLLYYNEETQTWEKPILREWDSIEKHANGKYYYHQRSGEVVFNGSENWSVRNDLPADNPQGTHLVFYVQDENFPIKARPNDTSSIVWISDIIQPLSHAYGWNTSVEGLHFGTFSKSQGANNCRYYINITKSKLSTQDVAGFKQWLQTNNITVVYQLAEEKVYECTNIDLITYANETNYVVESGAIVPKSILKVHNNISNVVSLLQKKVSLLESNVKASQEVQDMMILETDMRMLDIELALMEFAPMKLNLGGSNMLRSATYFNFLKNHIINETYEKEYLENVMNKYLATGRINQDEYDELYKMLYPPVYDIELPIEP